MPLTPQEFKDKMLELRDDRDEEAAHCAMDHEICALLRALGYGEGVDVFDAQGKWYA